MLCVSASASRKTSSRTVSRIYTGIVFQITKLWSWKYTSNGSSHIMMLHILYLIPAHQHPLNVPYDGRWGIISKHRSQLLSLDAAFSLRLTLGIAFSYGPQGTVWGLWRMA